MSAATGQTEVRDTALRRRLIRRTRAAGAGLDSPAGRAWETFLRAHAGLMRTLDTELRSDGELTLNDFDVLIQLGLAERGSLRMSELAQRTLVSKSGTTRRVEQLERDGLVRRSPSSDDRRTVVVSLTPAGTRALEGAVGVHSAGVARHFATQLTPAEHRQLKALLDKVAIDCSFG